MKDKSYRLLYCCVLGQLKCRRRNNNSNSYTNCKNLPYIVPFRSEILFLPIWSLWTCKGIAFLSILDIWFPGSTKVFKSGKPCKIFEAILQLYQALRITVCLLAWKLLYKISLILVLPRSTVWILGINFHKCHGTSPKAVSAKLTYVTLDIPKKVLSSRYLKKFISVVNSIFFKVVFCIL